MDSEVIPPAAMRLPYEPYDVWSGAPPIDQQLRNQIRTSSGVTWKGNGKLPPSMFGQGWRDAPARQRPELALAPADMLLAHLRRLARERSGLPAFSDLARASGVSTPSGKHNAKRARDLLAELKARGDVELRFASANEVSGTLAVRLRDGGAVLRQPRAPEQPFP